MTLEKRFSTDLRLSPISTLFIKFQNVSTQQYQGAQPKRFVQLSRGTYQTGIRYYLSQVKDKSLILFPVPGY